MLLNGAAQIEATALPFPQFALSIDEYVFISG
jgi:hypothetical protein